MTPLERHEQILALGLTHGVIKVDWIYPGLYPQLSIESAIKDLQALVKQKLLKRCGGGYYTPTERLCLHPSFGKTRGEHSIAKRVAVAAYCIRYGLERYSATQFKATFPELCTTGSRSSYYVDRSDQLRFGWAEPDCNINGDTRRLIDKCSHIFRVRARQPHWKRIIDDGRFHITVVTPSLGKKLVIQTWLTERKIGHPIYVEVVEELQQLLIRRIDRWRQGAVTSKSSSTGRRRSANGRSRNGRDNGSHSS